MRLKYTELSARCTARKICCGLAWYVASNPTAPRARRRHCSHIDFFQLAPDTDQQVVYRILQVEQPDVGLQFELRIRSERRKSASVNFGLAASSNASISAHSRRTMSRARASTFRHVLGMLPTSSIVTKLTQGERLRWTVHR